VFGECAGQLLIVRTYVWFLYARTIGDAIFPAKPTEQCEAFEIITIPNLWCPQSLPMAADCLVGFGFIEIYGTPMLGTTTRADPKPGMVSVVINPLGELLTVLDPVVHIAA
jgi:hypothetical protein